MIKNIFEERKYRKKYNTLKLLYDELLLEKQKLLEDNDFYKKQIKRLTQERNKLRNGSIK